MDTRLALISGAVFGGVLLAGAVVAGPGSLASVGPSSVASAAGNVFHLGENEEDDYYEEDEYEDDDHDEREHGDHDESREHDDDHEDDD